MKFSAFVGTSYNAQAPRADCERTVNWYFETNDSPGAKSPAALHPSPGFTPFATTQEAIGGRAAATMNNRTLFVMGFSVFGVTPNGQTERYGNVDLNSNLAQIAF